MTGSEARGLSHARVFGPPPGLYVTGLVDVIDIGNWSSTMDLAKHLIQGAQYLYSRHRHGEKVPGLYRGYLTDVRLVAQCRLFNGHHITDLDHCFEFLGGVSAEVAATRDEAVPVLVTDTTGRRMHTATAVDTTRVGLHAQPLNPAWAEAVLAHGHQGVGKIVEYITNLLGLAAITGEMAGWVFDAVYDRFPGDSEMLRRLRETNLHATAAIAGHLLGVDRRDL